MKPEPGRWHQATLTVGVGKAVLYVDGKSVGEAALAEAIAATEAPITLGGVNDNGMLRQQMLGAVDEARYEGRVLSVGAGGRGVSTDRCDARDPESGGFGRTALAGRRAGAEGRRIERARRACGFR